MEDTILIPKRLLDLTVNDLQDTIYLEDKYISIIKAIMQICIIFIILLIK